MKQKKMMFRQNVSVTDHGKKGSPTRRFQTKEEAEEFIENHARPHDLDCTFNKYYYDRIVGEEKR